MGASTFRRMRMRNKLRQKQNKPVLHMKTAEEQVIAVEDLIEDEENESEDVEVLNYDMLQAMTKSRLLKIVDEMDLEIDGRSRKEDIIQEILDYVDEED